MSDKEPSKSDSATYWAWVLGFILFSVVMGASQGGEVRVGAILVVLGLAAAFFFWAKSRS